MWIKCDGSIKEARFLLMAAEIENKQKTVIFTPFKENENYFLVGETV